MIGVVDASPGNVRGSVIVQREMSKLNAYTGQHLATTDRTPSILQEW